MKPNPLWAEVLQLVPVISLAFPIITSGEVDLSEMGMAFVVATLLAVLVHGLLRWKGHTANPILVGAALWLTAGAVGFAGGLAPLATVIAETQALGLFVGALGVGAAATLLSPTGYIGCRSDDAGWVRRSSLGLLGLTVAIVAWAWFFRDDVRLGGGVPFIVLNVARRVTIARAS